MYAYIYTCIYIYIYICTYIHACIHICTLTYITRTCMYMCVYVVMYISCSNSHRWNKGYNHLIFSMLSGEYSSYNTTPDFIYEHAMLAGSALDIINYRTGFDISIPIYNSLTIGEYKLDYYR